MSRFVGFKANTNSFVRKLKANLSLDFGSNQTRIMVNHELVWDQPTMLAWHTRLQLIVAIGDRAAALRGKTPAEIELISPIQKGVIAELDYATIYLKAILDQLRQQKIFFPWTAISCRTVLPANASPLETDQFQQVLIGLGMKVKKISSKTEAIVLLSDFKKIPYSHGIIAFGAQTVEMGIFVGDQLYKAVTITSVVGDNFTQAIIDQTLANYELQIGWEVAQQIKSQLSNSSIMTIRGKDAQTQLVKVVRVEAKKFLAQFHELAAALLGELKTVIDSLPPEISIQLQEQGFYLTGGGCQLSDWQELIEKSWQMPVITASTPMLDVVKGLDYGE